MKILQAFVIGSFTLPKIRLNPFFLSLNEKEKVPNIIIKYKDIQIKQRSKVTYLGCILDEAISGLSMTIISKINSRLKILQRKNKFLTPAL